MPFTRVDLLKGKPAEYRAAICDVVYQGLIKIMGAPDGDNFFVVGEHDRDNFVYEKNFLGMSRTDDLIFIQLYTTVGNTTDQKRLFYKHMVDGLKSKLGVRPDNVFINVVILAHEDWSFGRGEPWAVDLPS